MVFITKKAVSIVVVIVGLIVYVCVIVNLYPFFFQAKRKVLKLVDSVMTKEDKTTSTTQEKHDVIHGSNQCHSKVVKSQASPIMSHESL